MASSKRTQRQRGAVYRSHDYPENWDEIATAIKEAAGWKCERCGHPHDPENGYMLTVAHMIPDKSLVEPWNLASLCQRCHLDCQGKIDFEQPYFFLHSPWLAWRWEAYTKWLHELAAPAPAAEVTR